MASGIKISDGVKDTYQKISMTTSKKQKLKYAVFKFSDDVKEVVVETSASAEEADNDYDALLATLPPDDVRYIAYDFEFLNKDGTKKSEMILCSWHPVQAPIRKKMICASSFNSLRSVLSVNKNILEGDCLSELSSSAVLEKVGGKPLA